MTIEVSGDSFLDWAQTFFSLFAFLAASAGVVIAARSAAAASKAADAAVRSARVAEDVIEPVLVIRGSGLDGFGDPLFEIAAVNPSSPAANTIVVLSIEALGASHAVSMELGLLRENDPPRRFLLKIGGGLRYGREGGVPALISFSVTAMLRELDDSAVLGPFTHSELLVGEHELDEDGCLVGRVMIAASCERRLGGERLQFDGISFPFRTQFHEDDLALIGDDILATFLPEVAAEAAMVGKATAGSSRFREPG